MKNEKLNSKKRVVGKTFKQLLNDEYNNNDNNNT